jgi:hypothetical protein
VTVARNGLPSGMERGDSTKYGALASHRCAVARLVRV